jgi:hypothetical protein
MRYRSAQGPQEHFEPLSVIASEIGVVKRPQPQRNLHSKYNTGMTVFPSSSAKATSSSTFRELIEVGDKITRIREEVSSAS